MLTRKSLSNLSKVAQRAPLLPPQLSATTRLPAIPAGSNESAAILGTVDILMEASDNEDANLPIDLTEVALLRARCSIHSAILLAQQLLSANE